jgi:hypothetical protein
VREFIQASKIYQDSCEGLYSRALSISVLYVNILHSKKGTVEENASDLPGRSNRIFRISECVLSAEHIVSLHPVWDRLQLHFCASRLPDRMTLRAMRNLVSAVTLIPRTGGSHDQTRTHSLIAGLRRG